MHKKCTVYTYSMIERMGKSYCVRDRCKLSIVGQCRAHKLMEATWESAGGLLGWECDCASGVTVYSVPFVKMERTRTTSPILYFSPILSDLNILHMHSQ
jgi:hypothetical protein